jgi:hypothetical protein
MSEHIGTDSPAHNLWHQAELIGLATAAARTAHAEG